MATLRGVAKKAEVSMTTASRVLNHKLTGIPISEKTRKKVLKAAEKLNYHPNIFARSLRTKKTSIIGVVVSEIADPYFSKILDEIEQILNKWEYYFFLSSAQHKPEREEYYLRVLGSKYMDGFLFVGGAIPFTPSIRKTMKESEVPLVLMGRVFNGPNVGCVSVDNFKGELMATEYLIKQGHHDILYISRDKPTVDGQQRLNGYKSAMEKYNLKEKVWIVKGGISPQTGYSTMVKVLNGSRIPTAVLAFNDRCALGVMKAIQSHNLGIPKDIAVIGYDNLLMSEYFNPSLSTVDQLQHKVAMLGTEMLMRMINIPKEVKKENIILQPKLIIRESCKH